jgi:hypothetical protein
MAPRVPPDSTLDAILALQLTVAWAGEGRCDPRRLGWWQTDLVDSTAGGDFFARLLPRTHAWASLQAIREAARRVDQQARHGIATPDSLRTIFFLGFELDELLNERLAQHKRNGRAPQETLPFPVVLDGFASDSLTEVLRVPGASTPSYTVVPGGRQLKGAWPDAPDLGLRGLAAALLPFSEKYPLPFYRVGA